MRKNDSANQESQRRKAYSKPTLRCHGSIATLTQGGAGSGTDFSSMAMGMGMMMGMMM